MRRALGFVMAVVVVGCGDEPRTEAKAAATPSKVDVQGPVVARVDGEPVSLEDVRQTVFATGLSPAEALARIEAETLLADYAQRAGYGGSKQDERAIDSARVRALLRVTVEQGTAPEDMRDEDVRARFEKVRAQRERPEGRAILHVLFRVDDPSVDAKAKAAASRLLAHLRALAPEEARSALAAFPAKGVRDGLNVVREAINDARKDGKLAAPFEQAIFGVQTPQLLPEVVKTSFGYHVIEVQGIVPAVSLKFDDAEGPIRAALSTEARAKALEALIAQLKEKQRVTYDEEAIAKGLADDEILGDGT